jgi:hypothetical protein
MCLLFSENVPDHTALYYELYTQNSTDLSENLIYTIWSILQVLSMVIAILWVDNVVLLCESYKSESNLVTAITTLIAIISCICCWSFYFAPDNYIIIQHLPKHNVS